MRRFYILIANLLLITSLSAQSMNEEFSTDSLSMAKSNLLKTNFLKQAKFHIAMGANYYSFNNKNSVFTNWVSPEVSFQISSKFNIHVGTLILNENYNINSFSSENIHTPQNSTINRNFIYLSGDYQLSNRIRFRGTTFQEIPSKGGVNNRFEYNQLGIDIKISDFMYISADFINISGGNNANIFLKNPFYESTMDFLRGSHYPNPW